MAGLTGLMDLLSVTGFMLAIAGVLIAGEAYRRITPKADALAEAGPQSVEVLQKRIEILEKTIAEIETRERVIGHRLNTDLSDSERFAPSHHVLKRHYLA
jgi:hypothetical protein